MSRLKIHIENSKNIDIENLERAIKRAEKHREPISNRINLLCDVDKETGLSYREERELKELDKLGSELSKAITNLKEAKKSLEKSYDLAIQIDESEELQHVYYCNVFSNF